MQIGSPSDKTTKKGLQNQIRPGDIYGILQYIMPFIDPLEGQLQVQMFYCKMFFNRKQPLLSCKFFFIFLGGVFHKGNFLVGHFSQGSYFTMGIFSWRGIFWRGFSCFRFIRFFKHCSNGAKCFALVLTEIEIVLLNMPYIIATSRSSHRRWSIEKGILIYFVNFAGIHLFWSLFLKKFRKPF